MRFKDEKQMWYANTEMLAAKLSNKTEREVQEILDDHDVIELRSGERPTVSALGRLLFPVAVIVLLPIAAMKWVITGDRYLDTIYKRNPLFAKAMDYCGIK